MGVDEGGGEGGGDWRKEGWSVQCMPFLPQASKRQITQTFSSKLKFVKFEL